MKQIVFILAAIVFGSCSLNQKKQTASISGEVLSGDIHEVRFEYIVDNPLNDKGKQYVAELDSLSRFSLEIPLEDLATGRIRAGNFYHEICLLPGDDFFIRIDADTIHYKGKGAAKNNFLFQTEIRGLWNRAFYEETNRGQLSPKDFYQAMTDFREKRILFFDAYRDSVKLDKEFVGYYQMEAQVVFEDLIQNYPQRYSWFRKIPMDSIDLPVEFKQLGYLSNYVDDRKLIVPGYIHNLRNQLYPKAQDLFVKTGTDWNEAIHTVLFDSLTGKTREYVLAYWICTEFSRDHYDTLAINKFQEMEKDERAINAFQQALDKYNVKRSLINQPLHTEFAETLLLDTANQALTFGEMMAAYKGKVVYLDLWGMGCGPCRAAMPYSKILKEKLKDLPIVFVYVSVEAVGPDGWNPVFEATFTNENQYELKNGFYSRLHKFMEINWVPCYMIFDKEGKLVNYQADRPSVADEHGESSLAKTLKELASL
ncbi:MAG TPA: TlpA disulfide reductase family protein [Prolixibacteraceae bacterium]|nr:TlpA disulfide reductase family protein [Prolixibacteraceae bacterium]